MTLGFVWRRAGAPYGNPFALHGALVREATRFGGWLQLGGVLELLTYETDAVVISTFVSGLQHTGTYGHRAACGGHDDVLRLLRAVLDAGRDLGRLRGRRGPRRRCAGCTRRAVPARRAVRRVHRRRPARDGARLHGRSGSATTPAAWGSPTPRCASRSPPCSSACRGPRRPPSIMAMGRVGLGVRAQLAAFVHQPRAHDRSRRPARHDRRDAGDGRRQGRRDQLPARAIPPPRRGHRARAALLLGEQAHARRSALGAGASRLVLRVPAAQRQPRARPRRCWPSSCSGTIYIVVFACVIRATRLLLLRGPRLVRRDPPAPPLAHRPQPAHPAPGRAADRPAAPDRPTAWSSRPSRAPTTSHGASTRSARRRAPSTRSSSRTRADDPEAAARRARRAEPCTVLEVEAPGVLAAMAAGARATRADVICFTDDDAVPPTDWLERLRGGLRGRRARGRRRWPRRDRRRRPRRRRRATHARRRQGRLVRAPRRRPPPGRGHRTRRRLPEGRELAPTGGARSASRWASAAPAPRCTSRSPSAATRTPSATASVYDPAITVAHHPRRPARARTSATRRRARPSATRRTTSSSRSAARRASCASPTPRSSATAAPRASLRALLAFLRGDAETARRLRALGRAARSRAAGRSCAGAACATRPSTDPRRGAAAQRR